MRSFLSHLGDVDGDGEDEIACCVPMDDIDPPGEAPQEDDKYFGAVLILWRGEKLSFGGYGPSRDTYAAFADSPAKAPVFVPGWERPFEFERWIANSLRRGLRSI
jgi:hypothetical protein